MQKTMKRRRKKNKYSKTVKKQVGGKLSDAEFNILVNISKFIIKKNLQDDKYIKLIFSLYNKTSAHTILKTLRLLPIGEIFKNNQFTQTPGYVGTNIKTEKEMDANKIATLINIKFNRSTFGNDYDTYSGYTLDSNNKDRIINEILADSKKTLDENTGYNTIIGELKKAETLKALAEAAEVQKKQEAKAKRDAQAKQYAQANQAKATNEKQAKQQQDELINLRASVVTNNLKTEEEAKKMTKEELQNILQIRLEEQNARTAELVKAKEQIELEEEEKRKAKISEYYQMNSVEKTEHIYSKLIDYGINENNYIKQILALYPPKNTNVLDDKSDNADQLQKMLNKLDIYKIGEQNFTFKNDLNYKNNSENYDKDINNKIRINALISENDKQKLIKKMVYDFNNPHLFTFANSLPINKDNTVEANRIINKIAKSFNDNDEYVSKKKDDALELKVQKRIKLNAAAEAEELAKAKAAAEEEARLKGAAEEAEELAKAKAAEAEELEKAKALAEAEELARLKGEAVEAEEAARLKGEAAEAEEAATQIPEEARLKALAEAEEEARLKALAEAEELKKAKALEAEELARLKGEAVEAEEAATQIPEEATLKDTAAEAEEEKDAAILKALLAPAAEKLEKEAEELEALNINNNANYKFLPPIGDNFFKTILISNTMRALYSNRIWALHELLNPTSINNDKTIKYLYNITFTEKEDTGIKNIAQQKEDTDIENIVQKEETFTDIQNIAYGTYGFDLNFDGNMGHVLSEVELNESDKWALIYDDVNYVDQYGNPKNGKYYRKIYSLTTFEDIP
jgi:hypothetical protein